jgi:hypothetical protein
MTQQFKYFSNGELADSFGTGVSVVALAYVLNDEGKEVFIVQPKNPSGENSFGYLAKEITKEEFDLWAQRIAYPDMVEFFPGIFPGVGIVDKPTYEAIQERRRLAVIANRRVTRAQGLKAMARSGITKDAIYAAIDTLPGDQAVDARIDFDEQTTWTRSSELVKGMGATLGMTSQQLDDLFTLAATL